MTDNIKANAVDIGDMPLDEAERRLNLCPECLQNDGYHDAWCENVMAARDRMDP